MTELKPCPFCSAEPEILSDGWRTWGLVQHNEGCLFPTYPKHEIPESDFAAWNTRADDYRQAAEYWQRMYEQTFAERTCLNADDDKTDTWFMCSECECHVLIEYMGGGFGVPRYCPNCGAKVVE